MKQNNLMRAMIACVFVGCIATLGVFAPVAHAQTTVPVVVFNGATQTFSFQNVTTNVDEAGNNVPDLFPTLKSIVPGDSITQNITLSVRQIPSDQQVTIYLQAQSENDDYNALLESATLQVVHDGDDVTQSLAQRVALGTFDSAQTEETTVTLTVPVTVGNEISGLSANIDWIFSAEYTPAPSPTPTATPSGGSATQDSPKTGDANVWRLWLLLSGLAAGSVCVILQNKKEIKKN